MASALQIIKDLIANEDFSECSEDDMDSEDEEVVPEPPGEPLLDPEAVVVWKTGHEALSEYARKYVRYRGQNHFDQAPGALQELREMAVLKNTPKFSATFHLIYQIVNERRVRPQRIREAAEGVICLVERPLHEHALTSDSFWEDIQTFAHLTAILDAVFAYKCQQKRNNDKVRMAIGTKHLVHKLRAMVSPVNNYLTDIKPFTDIYQLIDQCAYDCATMVVETALSLEVAKILLLDQMLQKYLNAGNKLAGAWMNRVRFLAKTMVDGSPPSAAWRRSFRDVDERTSLYIGKADHRRSFRTHDIFLLPLPRLNSEHYAKMLTRQLSVGVMPIFEFESSEAFIEADETFFTNPFLSLETGIVEALCAMPDPVFEKNSFYRGLLPSPTSFSRHTCFERRPRVTSIIYVTAKPATRIDAVQFMCDRNCTPDNPACVSCASEYACQKIIVSTGEGLAAHVYKTLTYDIVLPDAAKKAIITVAGRYSDRMHVYTMVGRMVRIYTEKEFLPLALAPLTVEHDNTLKTRFQLFTTAF